MTPHRIANSSELLARKGAASPLGLRKVATNDIVDASAADAAQAHAEAGEPRQLTLVSGFDDKPAAGSPSEPPPPASLLPFALHWKGRDDGEAWELVSPDLFERITQAAEGKPSQEAPKPTLGAAKRAGKPEDTSTPLQVGAEPEAAPDSLEAAGLAPEVATLVSQTASEAESVVPQSRTQTLDAPEIRPVSPVADPSWRVGVDSLPSLRRAGTVRWLGWGVAAAVLIGGIGWWSFKSQAPAPEAAPSGVESGSMNSKSAAPNAVRGQDGAGPAQTLAPATNPAPKNSSAAPEAKAISNEPASAAKPSDADPGAPSVDLVRVEPNGEAVIAGRAAPDSELIVLDNGVPIGTVKADAFGEWVFVPEKPLPQGGHEFGLVLKSVQGKVSIPAEPKHNLDAPKASERPAGLAPPSEAAPAQGDGTRLHKEEQGLLAPLPPRKPATADNESAVVAPVPERKPELSSKPSAQSSSAGAPSADFVVQLASVKTRDGARQEWRKLQSRFPEALSGMNLNLHETKLLRQGTVIRVRTGPFPGRSEAVDFCAQIRASRQECLVVRTSGGN